MRAAYTGIAACKGIFAEVGRQLASGGAHGQQVSVARAQRPRNLGGKGRTARTRKKFWL